MQTSPRGPTELTTRLTPMVALRYRDYRLMFFGDAVSIAGTQMRVVAINWQVYQLAKATDWLDPALALGLIGLVQLTPVILTALLSGLVADRTDRRRLITTTSLIAFLCSGVLAAASTFTAVPLPLIYLTVGVAATANAFEMPARQALVTNLVPPQHLSNAVSLSMSASQLATVVGPSLAGILIAWGGSALVYWVDAVSFLAVVIAVRLMKTATAPAAREPVTLHAALEGLRFVLRHRLIASTMLLDFFATFFGAAMTLLPLFADQVLHVGPVELGWLYGAPAAGAMVSALALTSIRIKRQGSVLLWAVALYGLCTALFGLSASLPLTLLALAGTGAADTVSMVIRRTIRQLQTPDALRGRITAVGMIFFAGGPRLGELESGIAASLIGGPAAVFAGGLLCVVAVLAVAWRAPDLRRYDLETPPDAAR